MAQQQGPRRPQYPKIVESIHGINPDELLRCPLAQIDDLDYRRYELRLSCTPLLESVRHPTDHFIQLDQHHSLLLPLGDNRLPPRHDGHDIKEAITKVQNLLSRLPDVPQRSFSLPLNRGLVRKQGSTLWDGIKSGRWATRYILPEAQSALQSQPSEDAGSILKLLERMQDLAWDNLYVTRYIDSNSLTMAAVFAGQGTSPDLALAKRSLKYVNLLSELFDEYQSMCDAVSFGIEEPFEDPSDQGRALKNALFPENSEDHPQAMTIVKVFLWSAWQRSVMLHFYYVIGVQLSHGYSSIWNSLLAIRGVHELQSLSQDNYRDHCTEYLCNWAFEILRTGRTSMGLDFRRMISRFDAQFHEQPGRCIQGLPDACQAGQPDTCQRFTAAETAAQSVHGLACNRNCEKICWNAFSYYDCAKPAAISAIENSKHLDFAPVSRQTLAISHVWSHGQGGRPEFGINNCLHERYCQLARQFGCDTYWIDAAAIPSEPMLRRQAIDSINKIFATAKATVVIDKDIQAVDVTLPEPSVSQLETLLSVLLVSDWTVRGWTLLEGIRGSNAIFLLCRDDRIVNLRQALITLHQHGAIDIAVLLGSAQHLIPHSDPTSTKTVEEAGHLLSQRHTSWAEDVIICWSLLTNTPVQREAATFWRRHAKVRSGYLLSSTPRVTGVRGLSWAPSSPYVRPLRRNVQLDGPRTQEYTVRFPSYDGDGSLFCHITPSGLRGSWRFITFDAAMLDGARDQCCHVTQYQDEGVDLDDSDPVYAHPDEALAWFTVQALLDHGAAVRLVRALAEDGVSPYVGNSQRGEDFGLVAAICASFDKGCEWEWHGVYSWQESEDYEGWEVGEMLIF